MLTRLLLGCLGLMSIASGLLGAGWYTRALKESGRWFAIQGLFELGPGWWDKVFGESAGHHAYFQYTIPYLLCFALVIGGPALAWNACRSHQMSRA